VGDLIFVGPERTAQKKAAFVRALAEAYTVTAACQAVGIGRRTVYDWRAADPAFAQAWDDALQAAFDRLESSMYRQALGGNVALAIYLHKHGAKRFREATPTLAEIVGDVTALDLTNEGTWRQIAARLANLPIDMAVKPLGDIAALLLRLSQAEAKGQSSRLLDEMRAWMQEVVADGQGAEDDGHAAS
jgi:Na+/H+ antiporter NhaB